MKVWVIKETTSYWDKGANATASVTVCKDRGKAERERLRIERETVESSYDGSDASECDIENEVINAQADHEWFCGDEHTTWDIEEQEVLEA